MESSRNMSQQEVVGEHVHHNFAIPAIGGPMPAPKTDSKLTLKVNLSNVGSVGRWNPLGHSDLALAREGWQVSNLAT